MPVPQHLTRCFNRQAKSRCRVSRVEVGPKVRVPARPVPCALFNPFAILRHGDEVDAQAHRRSVWVRRHDALGDLFAHQLAQRVSASGSGHVFFSKRKPRRTQVARRPAVGLLRARVNNPLHPEVPRRHHHAVRHADVRHELMIPRHIPRPRVRGKVNHRVWLDLQHNVINLSRVAEIDPDVVAPTARFAGVLVHIDGPVTSRRKLFHHILSKPARTARHQNFHRPQATVS